MQDRVVRDTGAGTTANMNVKPYNDTVRGWVNREQRKDIRLYAIIDKYSPNHKSPNYNPITNSSYLLF